MPIPVQYGTVRNYDHRVPSHFAICKNIGQEDSWEFRRCFTDSPYSAQCSAINSTAWSWRLSTTTIDVYSTTAASEFSRHSFDRPSPTVFQSGDLQGRPRSVDLVQSNKRYAYSPEVLENSRKVPRQIDRGRTSALYTFLTNCDAHREISTPLWRPNSCAAYLLATPPTPLS